MVASGLKIFFWLEFKKKGGCSLATARLIFELDSEREWRQWNEKPLGRLFVSFDATGAVFGFRVAKLLFSLPEGRRSCHYGAL